MTNFANIALGNMENGGWKLIDFNQKKTNEIIQYKFPKK